MSTRSEHDDGEELGDDDVKLKEQSTVFLITSVSRQSVEMEKNPHCLGSVRVLGPPTKVAFGSGSCQLSEHRVWVL